MGFSVNFTGWLERISASGDAIWIAIATYLTIVELKVVALALMLGLIWLALVTNISRWARTRVHDARRRDLIVVLSAGVLAIFGVAAFRILPHVEDQLFKPQGTAVVDPVQPSGRISPPSLVAQQCPLLDSDKEADVIRGAQDVVRGTGPLRLLGGPSWGYFQIFAREMQLDSAEKGVQIMVEETSGSQENLNRLNSEVHPGTSAAPVQRDVRENHRARESFQVIDREIILEKMHLAVPKNSKAASLSDLKSKNIGVVGSGSENTLWQLLASAKVGATVVPMESKITPEKISQQFKERRIDALFYVVGAPALLFAKLVPDIRFLPIPQDLIQGNRHLSENFNVPTDLVYPKLDRIKTQAVQAELVALKNTDCRAVKFYKMLAKNHHHS